MFLLERLIKFFNILYICIFCDSPATYSGCNLKTIVLSTVVSVIKIKQQGYNPTWPDYVCAQAELTVFTDCIRHVHYLIYSRQVAYSRNNTTLSCSNSLFTQVKLQLTNKSLLLLCIVQCNLLWAFGHVPRISHSMSFLSS